MRLTLKKGSRGNQIRSKPLTWMNQRILPNPIPPPPDSFNPAVDHNCMNKTTKTMMNIRYNTMKVANTQHPNNTKVISNNRITGSRTVSVGEQTADIPVPRGRGVLGGGGLQGFSPGQGSTVFRSDHVDIPVPRGGPQGLRPGQGSRASSSSSRTAEGFSCFSRVCQPVRRSPARLFFTWRSRRALQLMESSGLWPRQFAG